MVCRVSCEKSTIYGCSVLTLQAEGRRFESVNSHKIKTTFSSRLFLCSLTDSFSLLRLGRLVCAVGAIVAEVYCCAIVSLVCIVKKVNKFPFSPTHPTLATSLLTSAPIPFLLGLLSASAAVRIGRGKKVLEVVRGC